MRLVELPPSTMTRWMTRLLIVQYALNLVLVLMMKKKWTNVSTKCMISFFVRCETRVDR
jgi:hypothetical protein